MVAISKREFVCDSFFSFSEIFLDGKCRFCTGKRARLLTSRATASDSTISTARDAANQRLRAERVEMTSPKSEGSEPARGPEVGLAAVVGG